MPAYGINEAAHYLGVPKATLRSWVLGRPYPTGARKRFFRPVIELPTEEERLLSFQNLVEAHVLDAIRRVHGVTFGRVRKAVEYLKKQFGSRHPLIRPSYSLLTARAQMPAVPDGKTLAG